MHLSKSQINLYRRCPFAYQCSYVDGIKNPPSSVMFVGSCFDKALNFNYEHKIIKGKDEKVSAVKDFFNDSFKEGKEQVDFKAEDKPEDIKDNGILTTAVFHKEVCKTVQPEAVQVMDDLVFDNVDYTLRVIVDLIEKDGTVVDNKFTRKTWQAGKEVGELDPVIYSLWYGHKKKVKNTRFRFDIGVGLKTPKTDRRMVIVTEEQKEGFLKYLAVINDCIMKDRERGLFAPNTSNFLCTKRHCGYWQICERTWNHKIKD